MPHPNTCVLSGSYSRRDAQAMGLSVRNRITWDKGGRNGMAQMNDGFTYMPNIVSLGKLSDDMGAYKAALSKIAEALPASTKCVFIENEQTTQIEQLVKMYGVTVDVFGKKGIRIGTSGTFPQVLNELYARTSPDAKAFRKRNQCSRDANVISAFTQEIALIKAAGLQSQMLYNWHYQFKDASYIDDFIQLFGFVADLTGMEQAGNECAVQVNETGIGTVLARACKMFTYAGIYNINQGAGAVRMNAAVQNEFVLSL